MAVIKVKLTNPKILTWARKELGLSVPDVAGCFKKDSAIIEAWEHGDNAPTFHQLVESAHSRDDKVLNC